MVQTDKSKLLREAIVPLLTSRASITLEFGRVRISVSDRLQEWTSSAIMLSMGLLLCFPEHLIISRGLSLMFDRFSISGLAFFFGTVGVARVLALIVNGNVPTYGPRVRMIGACLAVPVWTFLAMTLIVDAFFLGRVAVGLAFYGPLAVSDGISAYRATLDVGRC